MVNKVILIGNVGQEPEIKMTNNGSKLATFSLATAETWKDKSTGERKSLTQWHKIVIYNENIANVVENYVKKGSKIYIEGSINSRKYTDSAGVEKNITEIIINQFKGELVLLGSSSENSDKESFKKDFSKPEFSVEKIEEIIDDEIPF
jgi:single-strand DNA-binding protein